MIATSELVFSLQDDTFCLRFGDSELRLSEVRSAYFRRPEVPAFTSLPDDGYREYRTNEWLSGAEIRLSLPRRSMVSVIRAQS